MPMGRHSTPQRGPGCGEVVEAVPWRGSARDAPFRGRCLRRSVRPPPRQLQAAALVPVRREAAAATEASEPREDRGWIARALRRRPSMRDDAAGGVGTESSPRSGGETRGAGASNGRSPAATSSGRFAFCLRPSPRWGRLQPPPHRVGVERRGPPRGAAAAAGPSASREKAASQLNARCGRIRNRQRPTLRRGSASNCTTSASVESHGASIPRREPSGTRQSDARQGLRAGTLHTSVDDETVQSTTQSSSGPTRPAVL